MQSDAAPVVTNPDTIAAIATPAGVGGVGIIRLSGPDSHEIGKKVAGKIPSPGSFRFRKFRNAAGELIDQGLVLVFRQPHSFTGEDIVELHGHGGPVPMSMLLNACLDFGARQAEPGEFSQRAYLNDRIDLAQAEAIADLINSSTEQAARGAAQSLQGTFSEHMEALQAETLNFRMFVEAAIDFPEEEIDFLSDQGVFDRLRKLKQTLKKTIDSASSGEMLQQGIQAVITGHPNAGKSSLMNALIGRDTAIVTEVPGTTRDVVRGSINVDGLPVHLSDTAGIRDSQDRIERIGIERARQATRQADLVIEVRDITSPQKEQHNHSAENTVVVYSKIDLLSDTQTRDGDAVYLSSLTGEGLDDLLNHIKQFAGFDNKLANPFSARNRHITLLTAALGAVTSGEQVLRESGAGELLAAELQSAHDSLGQITGKVSADDLLGQIFSSFCIGK